ncbi:MAG TPA: hypothetical protein VGJ48_22565 [Pyrinomonadaceae bacterium]|jgi:hypothetical protein
MQVVDVLLLIAAVGIIFVAWRLLRDPRKLLKDFIPVSELGLYEGSLATLERAVIVAHRIENPEDSLREAVRNNIGRGVHYLFLVSRSKFADEKQLGYQLFAVFVDMVLRDGKSGAKVEDFLEIRPLPYDWEDTPYIFYELREEERRGVRRIIALRGNQKREGIAEGYFKVDPPFARTIYRSVILSAAESSEEETIDEQDLTFSGAKILRLPNPQRG